MQYGDLIACITETIIHHKINEGIPYEEAVEEAESEMLDWIIVGEERVQQKENENEEENEN